MVDELIMGWAAAAVFCLLAALPLGAVGVVSLVQAATGHAPEVGLTDWALIVATVFASYFVAASLAAPVCTLCRSIRDSIPGSMLTGALMATIIYGSVGLMAALVWDPVGRTFFGDGGTTQGEFLADMPVLLGLFAVIGLVAGPFIRTQWRNDAV